MGNDGAPAARRPRVMTRLFAGNALAGLAALLLIGDRTIAEIWFGADANSLVGFQAFVEQTLDPDPLDPTLWFDYILPLVETPAWLGVIVALTAFDALRLAVAWALWRAAAAARALIARRRA